MRKNWITHWITHFPVVKPSRQPRSRFGILVKRNSASVAGGQERVAVLRDGADGVPHNFL